MAFTPQTGRPPTVVLRIVRQDDGWRVEVSDGHARPVEGLLPGDAFSGVLRPLPQPRVAVRGGDAAVVQTEEAMGQALAQALAGAPGALAHLHELRGRAEGMGRRPVLVVDVAEAELRALPWELLAGRPDGPALEAADQAVVARRGTGAGAPPVGTPRVVAWCPTPEEPACSRMLADLRSACAAAGSPLLSAPPPDGPIVLVLVAHGQAAASHVAVSLGEEQASTASLAARMGQALRRSVLAILAVCEAGAATEAELDNVVGRLLAHGAGSVVAPGAPVGVAAMEQLLAGLVPALLQGETPAEAIAAGRAALRAWGHPRASSRWPNVQWHVASLAWANAPAPYASSWAPPGWPHPGVETRAWLHGAQKRAERDGFVGLEHLLDALAEQPGSGLTATLSRAALPLQAALGAALSTLTAMPRTGEALPISPRLQDYGRRLPAHFTAEHLARVVLGDPDLQLSGHLATTFGPETHGLAVVARPASRLMVRGGPEDGRVLDLTPGQTIGRAAPVGGPDHGLYDGGPLLDRALSRQHLQWVGRGRVRCSRPLERIRDTLRETLPPGEHEVQVGDALGLTPGTWLLGVT